MTVRPLHHTIVGAQALIGQVESIDRWAERARIPNRKEGGVLDGRTIRRILGIEAKSWDPELFSDLDVAAAVARSALDSAGLRPCDVDAAIVVSCTPFEVMLDQDAFRLLRAVGVPDDVVPTHLSAGCAGLARAVALASRLHARHVLIASYTAVSAVAQDRAGNFNPLYRDNRQHPMGELLWTSPAIFSDAAATLVLRREERATGCALYSRDSLGFGDGPGFADPLIHYLGGGVRHPPGSSESAALACYGMAGAQVRRYYAEGMMLNHRALLAERPGYVDAVRRIYTHQASPALIEEFGRAAGLPAEKAPSNARALGNLVTPCTVKMIHDDLLDATVRPGDELCVSVVGAGPERGAFILPVGEVRASAMTRDQVLRARAEAA